MMSKIMYARASIRVDFLYNCMTYESEEIVEGVNLTTIMGTEYYLCEAPTEFFDVPIEAKNIEVYLSTRDSANAVELTLSKRNNILLDGQTRYYIDRWEDVYPDLRLAMLMGYKFMTVEYEVDE